MITVCKQSSCVQTLLSNVLCALTGELNLDAISSILSTIVRRKTPLLSSRLINGGRLIIFPPYRAVC